MKGIDGFALGVSNDVPRDMGSPLSRPPPPTIPKRWLALDCVSILWVAFGRHPRHSWSYRAAYNKQGKYVGRVEINHAGLAAFTGIKGKKRLGNMSWERLFERLAKKE
jgi:hypothetical protein